VFRLFRSICSRWDATMATAVAPLARQVEARARHDSAFAHVLDAPLEAPTDRQGTLERIAARRNRIPFLQSGKAFVI
jgi:hypothetical protein